MALAAHTKANRKFFEKGQHPSPAKWRDWISRDIVRGKLIGDDIYVDMIWFDNNHVMSEPKQVAGITALDLLAS